MLSAPQKYFRLTEVFLWRPEWESNPLVEVLQTPAFPLRHLANDFAPREISTKKSHESTLV